METVRSRAMARTSGSIAVLYSGGEENIPRNNLVRSASDMSMEAASKGGRVKALKTVNSIGKELLGKNVMGS